MTPRLAHKPVSGEYRLTNAKALALSIGALTLAAPAPAAASASVQPLFQSLAGQRLSPAPLVPTTAPRSLSPIEDFIETFDAPRGYGVRMAAARRGRLYAIVALQGGQYPTTRNALRGFKRAGFRARSTRVRARRGYLLTRRRDRALLWTEDGVVYYLFTVTSKTVSLAELRATADGLDRMEGAFIGSDELGDNDAEVATTSRTVSVDVTFTGQCMAFGERSGTRRGTARVAFAPRQGDSFSFDIAPNVDRERSDLPWQGTVSGTVSANGATVNLRATGADAEDTCDTGPVTLALRPYATR